MEKAREKGKRKVELGQVSELGGKANQSGSLRSPQKFAGNAKELLPGLQNHIVLDHIVPKLPWRAFHILSSVSPHWRDAIQSRQVHDARARLNSLETLVAMTHMDTDGNLFHAISLYSLREDSWHQLPQFPFHMKKSPRSWDCVALAGNLYVLGGQPDSVRYGEEGYEEDAYREDSVYEDYDSDGQLIVPNTGREVFVLDLAGQRGWKRCADLPKPKFDFACGVLGRKVYVLGGTWYTNYPTCSELEGTNECWVYDPKEDLWSPIAPMLSNRSSHHVVAVGDKLWVHGGYCGKVSHAEVYNPAKDNWAYVEPQDSHDPADHLFTVKGKLYLITPEHIYGREESSNSECWTQRQVIHYDYRPGDEDLDEPNTLWIVGAQPVDHELLVMFQLIDAIRVPHVFLYRSEGFGTEQEEMYLNKVEEEMFKHLWHRPLMCPIHL